MQGIDYRNSPSKVEDWLPLEPFDDTEYDCRLPEEWISFGYDEEGNFSPVPGKGLFKHKDGTGVWKPVLIHSYDSEREVFTGYWDEEENTYTELTRINLLMNAEDPRIFAQRVAQAHEERQYADSQIRYNFFIDYMPQQQLPELDTEQVNRIQHMAMSSKYLKERQPVETTGILFEVSVDFGRTMNQIIMEKTMEKPEEERRNIVPANVTLPPPPPPKVVPYFGQVPIPKHEFAEQFSNFCFNSLFIKKEVILAMVQIRDHCNNVMTHQRIFNSTLNKTMRVEEFKQHQQSSISQLRFATRESGWVANLEKIIKQSFNDVGKGWFYIFEKSKETYEFGKLKKFLNLVNFMMQDTVLNLCKDSVHEFVESMLSYIPDSTEIISTAVVHNTFPKRALKEGEQEESEEEESAHLKPREDDLEEVVNTKKWLSSLFSKNKNPQPLYVLDLILKQNQLIPTFSTLPKQIVSSVKEIFEDGVKCLQEIPQLEPILMKHLFKTHGKKTIKAPIIPQEKPKPVDPSDKKKLPDENTWLWEAADLLIREMERAIEPLGDYVKTFSAFEKENALNPDKYVKEIDTIENPKPPIELRADIYENMKKEEQIKALIPESVQVGMFQINCKDIRNFYAGKFQQIVEKEIKLIQQKAKDETQKISAKFQEITAKINAVPKNIDELTETKKFISEIGVQIEKLKREIDEAMKVYTILDEFNVELTSLEFNNKWELFKAPKNVQKVIETQNEVLNKLKEQMLKSMELEQEEFDETLENLTSMIGGFGANDNMDKFIEYAQNVDNIDAKLQESEELARMYNQREFLVGKEIRDYTKLAQMKKDFQPYANLWRTIRTWHESHQNWLKCDWEKLDAAELENTFENCLKTIAQVFRFFRDREMPKVFQIAEKMKGEIDLFKPIVPLAVALRREGMKDRHWKAISEESKIDVYPDENFNLQKVVDLGLAAHVAVCDEVGEKAAKEFHIEKSLVKMKKEWEGLIFLTPKFKNTTTSTIGGFDDAITILDEHIVTAQAMSFSPFKGPFVQEIEEWCECLMKVSDTLEEWVKCQKSWMYLQPIFDSPDIMKQLPTETKRFKGVDNKWRFCMNQCQENPSILLNCSRDGLRDSFLESNKNLEIVQKGLADYLEKKRSNFARFYFLSNDELLEILSQTKEVRKVRAHLRKVFEAIADLTFQVDDTMTNMISGEGENIKFVRKIDPKDRNVEFWMGDVERQMIASVREVVEVGIFDYLEKPRTDWVVIHPGQVVLNSSQVHWTTDVEKAFDEGGLEGIKEYQAFLEKQLDGSVMLVRQKLSKLAKTSVNALIVIDVHAKDVVAEMVRCKISDKAAFEWVSQLRYYWY